MKASSMDAKVEKHEARRALAGLNGVGGIGIAWDSAGRQILRIDVAPGVDTRAVEQRLSALRVPYMIRTVSGVVTAL